MKSQFDASQQRPWFHNETRGLACDRWVGGHRAGQVESFRAATVWALQMLQDGHLADDVRFLVEIPRV